MIIEKRALETGERGRRHGRVILVLTALVGSLLAGVPVQPSPAEAQVEPQPSIVITRPGRTAYAGIVTVEGVVADVETADVDRVVFAIDTSGSTGDDGNDCDGDGTVGPGDDENGNGVQGEILDCEIRAVRTLIGDLSARSSIEVAIVPFASSASALDIPPGSGSTFAAPPTADEDSNGVPDVVDAARTLRQGGNTNFLAALGIVANLYDTEAAAGERWVTFFLSDGFNNGGAVGGVVTRLADQGTVVNSFSIGSGASGCASGDLRTIAEGTGGVCSEAEPTDVTAVLGQARPGDLDFVEVTFDGVTKRDEVQIDPFGRFSVDFDGVAPATAVPGSAQAQLLDGTPVGPTPFSVRILDQRFDPIQPERTYGGGSTAKNPTATQSDPVNTATGAYLATVTDIADQGTGIPFRLARTYNSNDPLSGDLGRGWLHPYEARLSGLGTGTVTVRGPDGQQVDFIEAPDGTFAPPSGSLADLSTGGPSGAAFTLLTRDQTLWLFGSDGLLLGIEDRNGEGIDIARADDGAIDRVTDADGATYDFTYAGDRLTEIHTGDGRSVHYGYTGGLLTSVTDLRGGTTRYSYNASELLAEVVDQNANLVVGNIYDADGRVVSQEDGRGSVGTFLWDADAEISTYVDARRNEWQDFYQDGVLMAQRDPLGNEISYDHDAHYNLTLVIDQKGKEWALDYDDRNNVIAVTGPAPTAPEVSMSYNDFDLPLEVTDANDNATTYRYDGAANLVGVTHADGTDTTIEVDPSGRPVRITDADGDTTSMTYGSDGNVASVTDPGGGESLFTWSGADHLSGSTDPNGNATTRAYDAAGLPLSLATPLGNQWGWTFDPAGNLVSQSDANANITRWTYDPANLLTSVEAPDGSLTSYAYDEVRNQTGRTDANGNATQWSYDERNLPATETDAAGNTWTYAFDPSGNLAEVVDANGNATTDPGDGSTTFTYDELDRPVAVGYSDPATPDVSLSYDAGGRRTTMSDGTGTTSWVWDELDRLAGVEAPTGAFEYDYEPDGDLATRTYPDGTEIAHAHDAVGRLLSVSDPEGTVSYSYDLAGRTLGVEFPNGASTSVDYDADDRPTRILTEGEGEAVVSDRRYDYDPVGNPLRLNASGPSDGDGDNGDEGGEDRPRLGFLDQILRLVRSFLDRLGLGSRFDFGRRFDRPSEPSEPPEEADAAWSETLAYDYDAQDRLVSVCYQESCPEADDPATSWAYDGVGNRLSETNIEGTATYGYDPADRLTSITRTEGSVDTFSYSPNGNRTAGPEETSYTWDQADRLLSAVTPEANSEYAYDGDGRRIEEVTEAGVRSYAWDHNGALDQVALTTLDGGTEARHSYGNDLVATQSGGESWWHHHDNIGSTTALTGGDGSALASYRFTPWGDERSFEAPVGREVPANPYLFTGERQDPTGLYHLRARQYDPSTGSFLSLDPVTRPMMMAGVSPFVYADNRPTLLVDPSGMTPKNGGSTGPWNVLNALKSIFVQPVHAAETCYGFSPEEQRQTGLDCETNDALREPDRVNCLKDEGFDQFRDQGSPESVVESVGAAVIGIWNATLGQVIGVYDFVRSKYDYLTDSASCTRV